MNRILRKGLLSLMTVGSVGIIAPMVFAQEVHFDSDLSDGSAPDNLPPGWSAGTNHQVTDNVHPDNWAVWDEDPDGTANTSFWIRGGTLNQQDDDVGWPLWVEASNAEPMIFEFRMYDFMDSADEEVSPGVVYGELLAPGPVLFAAGLNGNADHYYARHHPTGGWRQLEAEREEGWVTFKFVVRRNSFDVYVNGELDPNAVNLPWNGGATFDEIRMGGNFSGTAEAVLFDDIYLANDSSYAPAVEFTKHPGEDYLEGPSAVSEFGGTITFNVEAEGQEPLTYQWTRDHEPLTDDDRISGATTDTLTITGTDGVDTGRYRVVVTDSLDRSETSLGVDLLAQVEHEIIMNSQDLPGDAIVGTWDTSPTSGWFGAYYAGQVSTDEDERTVTFEPEITESGWYDIYTWFQPSWPGGNRTQEAPYIVQHADGEDTVFMNQQVDNVLEFWHYVGTYQFEEGTDGRVVLSNHILGPGGEDASGLVFADAVRWVPTDEPVEGPPASLHALGRNEDGHFQLSLSGQPNTSYVFSWSADLVEWTPFSVEETDAEGEVEVTDTESADADRRFYQAEIE